MKNFVLVATASLFAFVMAYASGTFSDLMKKSIDYYQNAEHAEYTIDVGIYDADHLVHSEKMHCYKDSRRQCFITGERTMIVEGEFLLSILEGERVFVIQDRSDSFSNKYTNQLFQMLSNWSELDINEQISLSNSERVFHIQMPELSDYMDVDMTFSKRTGLLMRSEILLRGTYQIDNEEVESPRLRIAYEELSNRNLKKMSLSDYLDKDHGPLPAYSEYTVYDLRTEKRK